MDKKIIYQDTGVILTCMKDYEHLEVVDIDIPEDAATLILGSGGDVPVQSYLLKGVRKCFPNITELIILGDVMHIRISNFMFPNVRSVVSYNERFPSHQALCQWKYNLHTLHPDNLLVLNTFCLREDETLDLKILRPELITITKWAFEGCRSRNIVWDSDRIKTEEHTFHGCSSVIQPYTDGAALLNNTVVDFDPGAKEIKLPPWVEYDFTHGTNPEGLKKLTISNTSQFDFIYHWISIETLEMRIKSSFLAKLDGFQYHSHHYQAIKNLEVDPDNEDLTSVDGVLFSKNLKTLASFPCGRTGHYAVPEGTECIYKASFWLSSLSSVDIPDSVQNVMDCAFKEAKISDIHLGKGMKVLPSHMFLACPNLEKVDIPPNIEEIAQRAFCACVNLKEVTLHDGLRQIGDNAFLNCQKLRTISLPETIRYLGTNSLMSIPDINLKGDDIPNGFIRAVFKNRTYRGNAADFTPVLKTIRQKGQSVRMPSFLMDRDYLDLGPNTKIIFDPAYIDSTPDLANDKETRDRMIIEMWNGFHSQERREYYGKLLRRSGRSVCAGLIEKKDEATLVKFLRMQILTKAAMKDMLEMIPVSMPAARGCLLEILSGDSKKGTFKL